MITTPEQREALRLGGWALDQWGHGFEAWSHSSDLTIRVYAKEEPEFFTYDSTWVPITIITRAATILGMKE